MCFGFVVKKWLIIIGLCCIGMQQAQAAEENCDVFYKHIPKSMKKTVPIKHKTVFYLKNTADNNNINKTIDWLMYGAQSIEETKPKIAEAGYFCALGIAKYYFHKDHIIIGELYAWLGSMYRSQYKMKKALFYLNKGLPFYLNTVNQVNESIYIADLFLDMAVVEDRLALIDLAKKHIDQADAIYKKHNKLTDKTYGQVLIEMLTIYINYYDIDKIKELYAKILDILNHPDNVNDSGRDDDFARLYTNTARAFIRYNLYEEAKYFIALAKEHINNMNDTEPYHALHLLNIEAENAFMLGDFALAVPNFKKISALATATLKSNDLIPFYRDAYLDWSAGSLSNLALINTLKGDFDTALKQTYEAIDITKKMQDTGIPNDVSQRHDICRTLIFTKRYKLAIPECNKAIAQYKKHYAWYKNSISNVLSYTALAYSYLNEHGKSNKLIKEAIKIDAQYNSDYSSGIIYYNYSEILAQQNQHSKAIFFGKRAINQTQSILARNAKLSTNEKISLLNNYRSRYVWVADLLIHQGRLPEAEDVMQRLKKSEFNKFIQRSNSAQSALPLSKEEKKANASITKKTKQLDVAQHSLNECNEKYKISNNMDNSACKKESMNYNQSLDQYITNYSKLKFNRTTQTALNKKQSIKIKQHQAHVQYLIAPNTLHILLTSNNKLINKTVKINDTDLRKKIVLYRELLGVRHVSPIKKSQQLYNLLIKPIEQELSNNKITELIITPDNSLSYIPFATLHDGKQYLVEQYQISRYSTVGATQTTSTKHKQSTVAGFGTSKAISGFSALPNVAKELKAIINGKQSNGVIKGKYYLDGAFTKAALQTSLKQDYPVFHVASHFDLNPGTLSRSFLLLGDGNKLTLNTVRNEFSFNDVHLFTLSACNSGISQYNSAGTEVDGLSTLILKQGAKNVIATLWKISSKSTSKLMAQLYTNYANNKNIARALREAQLKFIKGAKEFKHPYFWGAFTLQKS